MKKALLLFALVSCLGVSQMFAQAGDDRLAELQDQSAKEADSSWVVGGGFGLDFAQLGFFQPRVGAGANRIGFGGLSTFYANYKAGKFSWTNNASLQLAAQRIGGQGNPWEKNLDILRAASRAGVQLGEGKMYAAVEATLQTLVLPTYEGNILSPDNDAALLARFFSPVQIQVSPGIDYKVDDHLSFFLSPIAFKMIYVADDDIAALNLHGNVEGTNRFLGMGANLVANYNNKFFDDRVVWTSNLVLFSNYLLNPQNIDVQWNNDIGIILFKNLSLNLVTELFYDDEVDVQIDRNDNGIVGEEGEFAPSVSITEALVIKYNFIF